MKHLNQAFFHASGHLFSAILILFLFSFSALYAQTSATDHFRSRQTGNWGTPATWESSGDSINWINSTLIPNELSSSIVIRTGHIVTSASTNQQADQVVIQSGGKLIINQQFILSNGEGDDLTVFGILELNSNISTSAVIRMKGGSEYLKNISLNQFINNCIWEDGSILTLKIVNNPTEILQNLGQGYSNFKWDGSSQAAEYTINFPETFSVSGDLTIISTNGKNLVFTNSQYPITYTIGGNLLIQNKSYVNLSSNAAVTLIIHGNLNIGTLSSLQSRLGIGTLDIVNNQINIFGDINIIYGSGINSYSGHMNGTLNIVNTNNIQTINNQGTINRVNYIIKSGSCLTANSLSLSTGYSLSIENTGSLITSSPISGAMQRTLSNADWSVPLDGWHLLSSPVASQSLSTGGFLEPDYDFYAWDEAQNLWLNQKVPENNITSFNPGYGYFVAYDNGGTKSFAGTFNVASIPFTNLSKTDTSPYSGYHLLGNPFPCALDWSHTAWNRLNVSDVAMVWNETAMNYLPVTTTTNNIIPANQGFFVQAFQSTNAITVPQEARTHSIASFNKKGKVAEQIHLKVKCKNNGSWDEAIVQLDADALSGYDQKDGHEMEGSEYTPQLFTVIDGSEMLCVNTLPQNDMPPILPLHFIPGASDIYTIEVLENTMSRPVYLEDLSSGSIILLEDSTEIEFVSNASDNPERFRLHMGPVSLPESELNYDLQVYSYGNTVYINNSSGNGRNREYILRNLTGNIVARGKISNGSIFIQQFTQIVSGVYLIAVIRDQETEVFKVHIQN